MGRAVEIVKFPLPDGRTLEISSEISTKANRQCSGELHGLVVVGYTGPVESGEALPRAGSRPMSPIPCLAASGLARRHFLPVFAGEKSLTLGGNKSSAEPQQDVSPQ